MTYLARHWSFDPMLVLIALTVVAHEAGLRRLAAHSRAERTRWRRHRSILFYAGLAVLVVAIDSPVDYWASEYFYVHMIEHILLAFAFPVLVVAGAPWVPFFFCLPVGPRRAVGRFLYLDRRAAWLRAAGRFVRRPVVALVSFNLAMVVWHLPAAFTFAEENQWAHVWLMHASFIVTGVLFWLQIIPSHPMKPARGPVWQAGAILLTNVIMTVLAMSMSFLTTVNWYPTYAHLAGVTLSPFADQQIGAAILWVCGDFWAYPALVIVIRRSDRRRRVLRLESGRPGRCDGRSERDPCPSDDALVVSASPSSGSGEARTAGGRQWIERESDAPARRDGSFVPRRQLLSAERWRAPCGAWRTRSSSGCEDIDRVVVIGLQTGGVPVSRLLADATSPTIAGHPIDAGDPRRRLLPRRPRAPPRSDQPVTTSPVDLTDRTVVAGRRRALHRTHDPRRAQRAERLGPPAQRCSWRSWSTAGIGSCRSGRTTWARTCRRRATRPSWRPSRACGSATRGARDRLAARRKPAVARRPDA